MQEHSDFKEKYADNADIQNREIAFGKIFDDVMGKQRKNELDLYRLIAQDEGFKIAMQDTIKIMLSPHSNVNFTKYNQRSVWWLNAELCSIVLKF